MKKKIKNQKKFIVKSNVDLDKALGKGAREQALAENPHGFTKITKVHKSKKNYSRKVKHKS